MQLVDLALMGYDPLYHTAMLCKYRGKPRCDFWGHFYFNFTLVTLSSYFDNVFN